MTLKFMAWILTLVLASIAGAQHTQSTDSPQLALTHVVVIDATGVSPQSDRTVVIAGGRIVAIGPATSMTVSAGARIVDAHGLYLIPGLWDMHTHAFAEGSAHLLPLFISILQSQTESQVCATWRVSLTTSRQMSNGAWPFKQEQSSVHSY